MDTQTMQLFETLTQLAGPSGFEHEVREYVKQRLQPVSDEVIFDRLGSVFGVRHGDSQGPRVMVAGHLDEVGFLVTAITDRGLVKFQTLGGWWSQVLPAQRVEIITEQGRVPGVIGSIPPHLLDEAHRSKPLALEHMFIDIGADSREDAERIGIRPGLPAVPVCPFTPMANPKKLMAKAWDNRYGVGLAIELLEAVKDIALPNQLYAGATVQEELGLRGAETAARLINPDIFFALDASPANDTGGDPNAFGRLGAGALLRIYDRTMVTHKGLVDYIRDTAESNGIRYQYFVSPGGTDAGRVHLNGIGVPSAVIGIPSRYIHTSASIIHTDDYDAAKELLIKLVTSMDRTTFNTIVQY
jgi:putative aminopeptidase FrvX